MKLFVAVILSFLGAGSVVLAEDGQSLAVQPQVKKTQLVKDASGLHVVFSDGRELSIYEYIRPPKSFSIPLKQIENTCVPDQDLARCNMVIDLAPLHYLMIWTKHPDAKLLGTEPPGSNLDSFLFYYFSKSEDRLAKMFNPDKLSCDNYDWTHEMKTTPQGEFIVDAWSAETMFENRETKVNENLTFSAAFDVLLKADIKGDLNVIKWRSDYSVFDAGTTPYISSQVTNLNFISKNNKNCQISFESNVAGVGSAFNSPYFKDIDRTQLKPVFDVNPGLYTRMSQQVIFIISTLTAESGK